MKEPHKRQPPPTTDPWGITSSYLDVFKLPHRISPRTRRRLRQAMGIDPNQRRPLDTPDIWVIRPGQTRRLTEPALLTLEDGTELPIERRLPVDLPIGYHALRLKSAPHPIHLFVSPGACWLPPSLRTWGWTVPLYGLRSRASWGIGDLADLRRFGRWTSAQLKTGFVMVNPLGAPTPVRPIQPSPYYPSSRRFLNPLYLRVEEVPGARDVRLPLDRLAKAGRALNTARIIDRDAVYPLKLRALETLWKRFNGHRDFDRFRAEQGQSLQDFATFCALAERYQGGWPSWPTRYRQPDNAAVARFRRDHQQRVDFHSWLQWLLDNQLARASKAVPLMQDLPIGVDPGGADAWAWQATLASGVSVGAPPDAFGPRGQDWGLPPFVPHRLRTAAYQPFRETLQAVLRHAQGLRIDHVMGLFRLFWIPHGLSAAEGAFVRYPADELLAVLAIESHRAQAVVVGEDLGTVEPGVRPEMRRRNLLSYRLLWFEQRPPESYPEACLAALTTHDLFTVKGLWTGTDLQDQERIGLSTNAKETERIRRRVAKLTGLPPSAPATTVIERLHQRLARSAARLLTATLEDGLGVAERPNMPGTTAEWPNWSIALPKSLEGIQRDPLVRHVAKAMKR